jgi:hypothetical protein
VRDAREILPVSGAAAPAAALCKVRYTHCGMRRVTRHLFTLSSAVSLLLCVATAVLFVHSGFRYVYLSVGATPAHVHWELGSTRGRIYFARVADPNGFRNLPGWRLGGGPGAGPAAWSWRLGGFDAYHRASPPQGPDFRQYVVPHYFLALVALVLPVRWWTSRRASSPGLCPACGYDLRASPERCPECGTAAVEAKA